MGSNPDNTHIDKIEINLDLFAFLSAALYVVKVLRGVVNEQESTSSEVQYQLNLHTAFHI